MFDNLIESKPKKNARRIFGVGAVVASRVVPAERRAQAIALMFTGLTLANVLGVTGRVRAGPHARQPGRRAAGRLAPDALGHRHFHRADHGVTYGSLPWLGAGLATAGLAFSVLSWTLDRRAPVAA